VSSPGDSQPLLWGRWRTVFHPSGSCMVALVDSADAKPHLYVFADPLPEDPLRGQRNRRLMCTILAAYLTGEGQRPVWLDDFYPKGKGALEAITGAVIMATGPWHRSGGSPAVWRQEKTLEARRNRLLLLKTLLGGR